MTLLNQTPIWVITLITVMVISNTVRYGYKVLFSFSLILLPVFAIAFTVITVFIPATGLFHSEFIFPILNRMVIFVLGPKIAASSTLPLLETVQLIELAEVFERMDALFTLLLFLGLIIKMVAFFNGP